MIWTVCKSIIDFLKLRLVCNHDHFDNQDHFIHVAQKIPAPSLEPGIKRASRDSEVLLSRFQLQEATLQ